jgi:hypothetical protein
MQARDEAVRVRVADALLRLAGTARMAPSYEFIVVDDFLRAVEQLSKTAIKTREHFTYHRESSARMFLGMLALLARGHEAPSSLREEILRAKLKNQALHAIAVADPKAWLKGLLLCASKFLVTSGDPFELLDAATEADLRGAVEEAAVGAPGVDDRVRRKLQQHRQSISAAYGAIEIGACVEAALPLSGELEAAFDRDGVADAVRAMNVSLSPQRQSVMTLHDLLQHLMLGFARCGLLTARVSNEVVLREIETAAGERTVPTPGTVFDADHAVYITRMNVFITDDKALGDALRPISKRLTEAGRRVEVCTMDRSATVIRSMLA